MVRDVKLLAAVLPMPYDEGKRTRSAHLRRVLHIVLLERLAWEIVAIALREMDSQEIQAGIQGLEIYNNVPEGDIMTLFAKK